MTPIDWPRFLGVPPDGALAVVVATAAVYVVLAVLLSRMGRRLFSSPSSLDLAAATVLGAVAGRSMLGHTPTLGGGLVALATLVVLEGIVGRLRASGPVRARRDRGVALVVAGRVRPEAMRRHGLDETRLWSALRGAGVTDLADVAVAILEPTGRLSVLRGSHVTREALTGVRDADAVLAALAPTAPGAP